MQETWDTGSIPWSGRHPRGGNGHPLQYSWNIQYSRIPRTEGPGWLQSLGSQRVGHDLVTKQQHKEWGIQALVSWLSFSNEITLNIDLLKNFFHTFAIHQESYPTVRKQGWTQLTKAPSIKVCEPGAGFLTIKSKSWTKVLSRLKFH